MSRRRKPRRPPVQRRPRILSEDVEARLVNASRMGVAVEVAAEMAGVSRSSFMGWMQHGRVESEAREAGGTPDPDMDAYVELFEKVRQARAAAAVRAVANIRRVADGGIVTKVVTRRLRDPITNQVVEEITEDRTAPDWRADAWYLERQHREHYGKDAIVTFINASDQGPLQNDPDDDASDLAERLAISLHAITYPELDAPPIADAEILE
ncbi:hypothetical protein G3I60_05435 [Streptomyces sp. SID13666]|uniref:hypothetical protein n=1 Tax=Streptomyces sp. SID13666 TaxID=2706054 RepID=UPI0013C0A071|nr:hypothetical protein [Streptomyces sp. SID13666]NEA53614.1 hypothetical protein [Streptomyces sp. SID13666]